MTHENEDRTARAHQLECRQVVVVTETKRGNESVKTISRVVQFPESLITALPQSMKSHDKEGIK